MLASSELISIICIGVGRCSILWGPGMDLDFCKGCQNEVEVPGVGGFTVNSGTLTLQCAKHTLKCET